MDVYQGILSHGQFLHDEALTVIVTGGLQKGSHITVFWKWTQTPSGESQAPLVIYQGEIQEEFGAGTRSTERQFVHKGAYDLSFSVRGNSLSLTVTSNQGSLGAFPKTTLTHTYSIPAEQAQYIPSLFVGLTPKLPYFSDTYLIAALVPEPVEPGTPAVILWHENHTKEIPAHDRLVKYELEIADVEESHDFQEVAGGPHFYLRGGVDAFNAIVHQDNSSLKFRIASADSDLPEGQKWASLHRYPLTA